MARKNLIEVSAAGADLQQVESISATRPIAGMVGIRHASPIGGIAKSLGSITQQVERAQDIERQMAEGIAVVELETSLIDASMVRDRLTIDATELALLAEQIKEHGQQVPILVRPHPKAPGRYQVAYGHRRLAAVSSLGIKVKAVVRNLTDDELVVSQGQENNARANLSFIERAVFAIRLEDLSFTRDIIMSALGVDKTGLSKMISAARAVPPELVEAIGPAPDVGRRRWEELAELVTLPKVPELVALLSSESAKASSNDRFQDVVDALTKKKPAKVASESSSNDWEPVGKLVKVTARTNGKTYTLALKNKDATGFGGWISANLERLYEAFKDAEKSETGD